MANKEISVVIPTHNRNAILKKCLTALNEQSYPSDKFEIIIIDDGSNDNTGQMVKKLDINIDLIYRYQEQTGPSGARNHGINLAKGKYIIFIDDDIIVIPKFIESHINMHKEDMLVVHGPVIYTNNLDNPTAEEKKISDYSRAFFATGNASIARKHLLDAGLFDERFTEYGWEDLELGKRLQKLGLKAVKSRNARGYHLKHKFSIKNLPALMEKERQRGRMAVLFYHINPSWSVRMTTLYWTPFFLLEKLLNIGGWPEWSYTEKILKNACENNYSFARNFILEFKKLHSYFKGMKEGPDQLPEQD